MEDPGPGEGGGDDGSIVRLRRLFRAQPGIWSRPMIREGQKRGVSPVEEEKEEMPRLRTLTVFLIFLLLGLVFWPGCETQERLLLTAEAEDLPLMKAEGIVLTEWNDRGEKIWQLRAVSGSQTLKRMSLNQVKIFLYQEGRVASKGEAKEVIVDNQSSDLLLKGDVRLFSYPEGDELLTAELHWNNQARKLWTEEEIILKKSGLITRGRGLVGDPDLATIVMGDSVTTYLGNTGD